MDDVAARSVPPRGSSKRSRAAEVHNLSEKVDLHFEAFFFFEICDGVVLILLIFPMLCFWVFMCGVVWQRRRSRINEKMKALQNLIPNSNKVHKHTRNQFWPLYSLIGSNS